MSIKRILLCRTWPLMLLVAAAATLFSCSDKVDDSDMYTFGGETAYSYLQKTDEYTDFAYILSRVKLSKKSESQLSELLSARGHYTVFAPTNSAIQHYLDSVYATPGYDIRQITDSVANYIARNSIIDNGEAEAYMSTSFESGVLEKTNMEDRYITINFDTLPGGHLATMVNNWSRIVNSDIEVSNGIIHGVNRVLELSQATLPSLIKQTGNLRIFSHLLEATGWADSMQQIRDENYEENHQETSVDLDGTTVLRSPDHRYIGYTAFVETDSIFEQKWGIPAPVEVNGIVQNWDEIMAAVQQKCREAYPAATDASLTSMDNAVNQFVSYHLLPARITFDKLVIHYAEMGYGYSNPNNLSIDCFEYYETMGLPRRLIKLTEGRQTNGKRINRHATYDTDNYNEVSVDREGLLVTNTNGNYSINSINGFYYPVNDILVYDSDVPNKVLNERLRFDISSLLPELMTNGYRRLSENSSIYLPEGYFKNFRLGQGCNYHYLPGYATTWPDFQGDEHNVTGQYDMTLRLPPVPYEGTYEIRWAVPTFPSRGMAQLYLGTDPDNLPAIGLPLDLRLAPTNPQIGWEADTDDEDHNEENDKTMRNHGYMKPPLHDGITRSGAPVTESLRNTTTYMSYLRLRKIIWTGRIKPSDVLYLRIKSVLENTKTQFVMDWMELVPKSVYNGTQQEDRW